VLSLTKISRLLKRRLQGQTPDEIAKRYTALFFVSFATAEYPALLGFVGFFVTNRLWVYVLGMSFSVVGLALIAPGRRNLARLQTRLREDGSSMSLVGALMARPIDKR
jgi:hypothetical protein